MRSVPDFLTVAKPKRPRVSSSDLAKAIERNAMNQKKKDQIKRIEAEVAELKLLIENQIDNLAKITIELGKLKAGK